ncbi:MAG: ABC transporter ATP-binding protein [Alphaproteobacteria bacterium]|nr:ABC transporter ATP-binding protein [Alphaproteobacteria bacterium]
MIEIDNLGKRFGAIVAVDGISLQVARGEVLGFLGPNGAGKSTTMKMVAGYLSPTSGTARVCGFDVVDHPIEVKRHLGYLPEGAPAYPDMTAEGFLRFCAELRGFSGAERDRRIGRAVELTQLKGVMAQPIDTLSKGFKRRVGLAQALLHDPEVLVLDEPTDGLDPNQKHEVRGLIRAMAPEKAIVISTHILEEVDAVCSRAVIIAGGRLVADGTPAEFEARSRHHNAVTIALPAAQAPGAAEALKAASGVAAVELGDSAGPHVRLTVIPSDGQDIAASLRALVAQKGWQIAEFHVERGRLDEVFRAITTRAAPETAHA